jgi:hypothetical protein
MRALPCIGLLLVAWGCSKDREGGPSSEVPSGTKSPAVDVVEPAQLAGEYVGKLTGDPDPEDRSLPTSIREAIGDETLTIEAEPARFRMTHKWLNLEGTYTLQGDTLALKVETVEGLSAEDLASADLQANRRAGKEPASEEMLEFFQQVLLLTDWRFKVEGDTLTQVGEGSLQPLYRFTKKPS